MKPWNQAAWKHDTYRTRVSVGPVGDEALNRGGFDIPLTALKALLKASGVE